MNVPKFLLADNTDHPDDIFVIHSEYPRFIINLANDDIEWYDEFRGEESEIVNEISDLIEQVGLFYDRETERYSKE